MRDQLPERMVPVETARPRGHLLAASVLLLASIALPGVFASPVAAANELRNGSVTPVLGTTQTSFTFSVDYATPSPQQAASSVTALVGPASVGLVLSAGTATNGTWTGQSTLPAGTWQVTFVAETQGSDPTLTGPPVVVVELPPTATPTPMPTPPPTATPPPATPTAAPRPIPPMPTGAPPPTFGPPIPSGTPAAPELATPTASASPTSSARPTPSASATGASESARPSGAAAPRTPSPSAPPAEDPTETAAGTNPWLFVGAGLAFLGALILGDQLLLRRAGRSPAPVEGE